MGSTTRATRLHLRAAGSSAFDTAVRCLLSVSGLPGGPPLGLRGSGLRGSSSDGLLGGGGRGILIMASPTVLGLFERPMLHRERWRLAAARPGANGPAGDDMVWCGGGEQWRRGSGGRDHNEFCFARIQQMRGSPRSKFKKLIPNCTLGTLKAKIHRIVGTCLYYLHVPSHYLYARAFNATSGWIVRARIVRPGR